MWEFTSHEFAAPDRWTWAQVAPSGRTIQRSREAFSSWVNAVADATAHGFDPASDGFDVIRLAAKQPQAAGAQPGYQGRSAS
jgi:hypothetical protein